MIKIETFETGAIDVLRNVINTWIEANPQFKLIDIKYFVAATGKDPKYFAGYMYSAMILYQQKGQSKTYSELSKEESREDIKINRNS